MSDSDEELEAEYKAKWEKKQEHKRKRCHEGVDLVIYRNEAKQHQYHALSIDHYMLCEASPVLAAMLSAEWSDQEKGNRLELWHEDGEVLVVFCELCLGFLVL